ncbi:MAG: DUF1573 domain-containing protein [Sphingobacteriales bacterium]|nr:MAG: DUF1573 domain-containing protein [Sphingobacteriales bacterium]
MKKFFTLVVALLFVSIASYAQTNQKKDGPQITFKEEMHDFGKVKEGVVAEYEFKFTNTGNQPLILSDVRASCGCTTPNWSKEPIMAGKTGVIKVAYNSSGRPGAFNKSITITTNIPDETKVLFIKGDVEPTTDTNQNPNQSPVRLGN